MKNILLGCSMLLAMTAYASEPNRADVLREKILSGDTSEVLVVAHRGAWRYVPRTRLPPLNIR